MTLTPGQCRLVLVGGLLLSAILLATILYLRRAEPAEETPRNQTISRQRATGARNLIDEQDDQPALQFVGEPPRVAFVHHDNNDIAVLLHAFAAHAPHLTRLYNIGKTTKRNDLWALEISDHPGVHEPGEIEVKLVGNIHGNEVVGREVLLHFVSYLLANYDRNATIKALVDSTRIHIVPTINPDGYVQAKAGDCDDVVGRLNANNVDLNRDFPDRTKPKRVNEPQLETMYVMEWSKRYSFVLSLALHGGALVVNYPYDNNPQGESVYTKSPDDDYFRYLSLVYAKGNPSMAYNGTCYDACNQDVEFFAHSITNGAAWYALEGGMQDWNYEAAECFELTIELGCKKYPEADKLERYWLDNRPAMINWLRAAYVGVHGFVMDPVGRALPGATIKVANIDKVVHTHPDGDYWRPLAPNRHYNVTATKAGYQARTILVSLHSTDNVELNFVLFPLTNEA